MKKRKLNKIIIGTGCSFVQGAEIEKGKSFIDCLGGINLGEESSGNAGAVTRVLMADIPSNSTVIFMPTGMNRVDLFRRDGNGFEHVFPHTSPVNIGSVELVNLEKALSFFVSEKTEVLNAIVSIVNIQNFCKANGHNLIMFPAFTREYNKEYFYKIINSNFVNSVEWDRFLTIDGCSNFFDWTVKQAGSTAELSMMEMHFTDKKFPELNGWIMPRFHPSETAHSYFAERICEFL